MTKDEALKLALEAMEWSYGGEPMPTKELEAMQAVRQVLADQKGDEMTDIKTNLSTALWCDLQTDKEKAAWLLLGRGFETGVVCKSIQNDLAQAYGRIIELRQALAEWTPDDTAYRPDGLSQEELPPVKSYCGGKPNYCEPEMDKQCSSCGGFCGDVCERENVEPDLLNQTCCGCGRSGGYALYCGWCWNKADKESK